MGSPLFLIRWTFLMVLWFCSLSTLSAPVPEHRSIDPEALSEAIRDTQRSYKMEVTGPMEQQAAIAMVRPHCGGPDETTDAERGAYTVDGRKWDTHNLTYSIENFAPNIAWYETFDAIRRAIQVWEKVTALTFEEIPYEDIHHGRRNVADIMISFESRDHRSCLPFGERELGHAYYPGNDELSGDVHFNLQWQWSNTNKDVSDSNNVFLVALHELGHSLGLAHSKDQSAIMFKSYHWMETENFQLPADDLQGIQRIYGWMMGMQQHEVDVTLDPDTANPWLILSDDRKQVSCGDIRKNLPDNTERFNADACVLGKQGFSSGRFYYEVQVGGKTHWDLGVARESINRKGHITLNPDIGYWAIGLRNRNEYKARADPPVPLPVREELQTVGVFVDYEEGLVSFYDMEARVHLYSFTGCTFTERLYPYFSPGVNEDGTNSAPLIISPVSMT